jgi:hypothetical protein
MADMKAASVKVGRLADLSYSKEHGRITLSVPPGTKIRDLAKILDIVAQDNFLARLPRGCLQCTSGDHFDIRERFDPIIRIDLDRKAIFGN